MYEIGELEQTLTWSSLQNCLTTHYTFSKTMTLAFRIDMMCASQQVSQTPYRVQDVY